MKIAMVGPSELTNFDKLEIVSYIDAFVKEGYHICILAYRSVESEVFKYFIDYIDTKKEQIKQIQSSLMNGEINLTPEELDHLYDSIDLSNKLTIYTFQKLEQLPDRLKLPVKYLESNGANYFSFEIDNLVIYRPEYTRVWNSIVSDSDITICFYDGDNPKLLIPIDEAKKQDKTAFLYNLPRDSEEKHRLLPEEKMEKKSPIARENLV